MEGDSFFYVFQRATAAVAAVVAAQRALAAHVFPEQAVIRVRMGLHTGEASLGSAATGADYVGYDVHRAARIANAGHGGQVLLSETRRACSCATALPAGVTLRDLGEHRFKDLAPPGARAPARHRRPAGGLPAQLRAWTPSPTTCPCS